MLGGDTAVMPSAARECQLLWELPAAVEMAVVALDLPARLHYAIGADTE